MTYRPETFRIVARGDTEESFIPVEEEGTWLVGSDPDCDIHLPVRGVKPRHVRVTFEDGSIWVEALDGAVYVRERNERRFLERETVHDGQYVNLAYDASLGFVFGLRQRVADADPLAADVYEPLRDAVARRNRPASHIVLPSDSGLVAHAFDGSGTQVLPAWADGRIMSIDGARAATLQTDDLGDLGIYVFDLQRGEFVRSLRVPEALGATCVLLVGDFVFAGGRRLAFRRVDGGGEWFDLLLPPEVDKMMKGIDYLGVADGMLWAIDDVVMPLYAARYDISDPGFHQLPAVLEFDVGPRPHVYDFDCNDRVLITVVDQESGWVGFNRHVVARAPRTMTWVEVVECEPNWRGSTPPGIPRTARVVGETVVVARGPVGITVARVDSPDSPVTVPPPEGTSILNVVTAEPDRVFAVLESGSRPWIEFSLEKLEWIETADVVR